MRMKSPSIEQAVDAIHVLHLILEVNTGVGHYVCPLCGLNINHEETDEESDHDEACQYVKYSKKYYDQSALRRAGINPQ